MSVAHFEAEVVNPTDGYPERDVAWFERYILPDFLATAQRRNFGPSLLDVGCGYGYFTKRYAKHFMPVLGVDFSPKRIAAAQERNLAPGVEYRCGDLRTTPIERSFHAAVSSAVLQHIHPQDRRAALATIAHAVVPGGYLICYDERFEDSPMEWDPLSCYQPISRDELITLGKGLWTVRDCDFVTRSALGNCPIFRFELQAL